jgi:PmbA protein
MERLAREGCQVNVAVERSVAETTVGNTAGAHGAYRSTGVSVSADVRRVGGGAGAAGAGGDDVLMVYDYYVGGDLPSDADLDALVRSVETRLSLALRVVEPPHGALPVVFTPAGLAPVLLPLEQAFSGKAVLQGISPFAGRVGEQAFDPRFSFTDDAVTPAGPSSRPVDDEGVPSRVTRLVERGVVREFVYDLETAARARAASTGHGRRGVFGKPGIAYTNLVVGAGPNDVAARLNDVGARLNDVGARHAVPPHNSAAPLRPPGSNGMGTRPNDSPAPAPFAGGLTDGIDDGLVVDDLIGVGQGNVIGGAFSHPVGLAYRVRRGEILGRVKDAAVAGNAYEMLKAIGGFGSDGRWLGSRWAPSVLFEGVSVARR